MDCQQRGINMTSVADGSQLGFLSTRELCTLVGAPLDNAIESVLAEPDPEKRLLRVAIYNQSGCVMLRFENYCAQPVEMGADGLPVHNAHGGYDLQGVQAAAQRHDGHHDPSLGRRLVHPADLAAGPGKVKGLLQSPAVTAPSGREPLVESETLSSLPRATSLRGLPRQRLGEFLLFGMMHNKTALEIVDQHNKI